MFRFAFQVTCMLILVSVFYDVFSCNSIHKTQTYRYIKQFGSSKYAKEIYKKLKNVKKKYLKSLVWPLCNTPTSHGKTAQVMEHSMYFIQSPENLKNNVISQLQHVVFYFGKNLSSLQYPISILFCDLMKAGKAGAAAVIHQIQKCAEMTMEYLTKVVVLFH